MNQEEFIEILKDNGRYDLVDMYTPKPYREEQIKEAIKKRDEAQKRLCEITQRNNALMEYINNLLEKEQENERPNRKN